MSNGPEDREEVNAPYGDENWQEQMLYSDEVVPESDPMDDWQTYEDD